MKNLNQITKILADHRGELQSKYNVKTIAVFGSYARGDNSAASDLDVLVDLKKPVGWEIVDLQEYLQSILKMKVDLVTKGAVTRKAILWKSIQEDLVNV